MRKIRLRFKKGALPHGWDILNSLSFTGEKNSLWILLRVSVLLIHLAPKHLSCINELNALFYIRSRCLDIDECL